MGTGSGFGIVFRASITNDRITGYSFDMDPVAGGGGYLVRLWDGSRQHCRGERVGIQAWATTEVTVESFRVAQL